MSMVQFFKKVRDGISKYSYFSYKITKDSQVLGKSNCEVVQTCGMCEEICDKDDIKAHNCLEGYNSYIIDPNTLYFYPLADDGITIVRKSNVNNTEELVEEPFYDNNKNNIIHISQKGKQQDPGQLKQTSNKRSKLNDSSRNKLNFDDEEFVILEVQKRPPLWDYSLPLIQRKSTIKQRLWSEIALTLNGKISAEEAQKKFKSLHDTYRKIIQSEQRPSGSARRDTMQKWPHYYSISYLKDSCLQKITVSNINNEDSNSLMDDDEYNTGSIQTDFHEERKNSKNDSTNAMERIADALYKEKNIVLPPQPEPDEMDSFLMLVGFRLQKLSAKSRFEIMQKILQLTYEVIIKECVL